MKYLVDCKVAIQLRRNHQSFVFHLIGAKFWNIQECRVYEWLVLWNNSILPHRFYTLLSSKDYYKSSRLLVPRETWQNIPLQQPKSIKIQAHYLKAKESRVRLRHILVFKSIGNKNPHIIINGISLNFT